MTEGETELEMVRRHVREDGGRVRWEREAVAGLKAQGALAGTAVDLLETFEGTLRRHKEHLARLEPEDPSSGA